MKVYFAPGGGEEQEYEFQIGKVNRLDAAEAERIYGASLEQVWMDASEHMSTAMGVVLYLCLKKAHPKYKYSELPNYDFDELRVEPQAYDLKRMIKLVERSKGRSPSDKAAAIEQLEERLAHLEDDEGKASEATASTSSETSTGSTSPSTSPDSGPES